MAGEWLKLECSTPDKPEVFAITAKMGWDDPDLAVGKLFRVWRWFDQQTVDGNAHSVTTALLDRIAGATGFAQTMVDVGWLTVTGDGLALPNFDKHNGATAKSRAQTAKRVANHRSDAPSNVACNASTVTPPLAREEKKRKETNLKTTAQNPAGFARFWAAYPKKKSKGDAEKAFKAIKPSEQVLEAILQAIPRAMTSVDWMKEGGQFIPYPASWLRSKGWEDVLDGTTLAPDGQAKPWWESMSGVAAKGREYGLEQTEDVFAYYRDRVFKAAGDGPWNNGARR